ncbi:transglycosylase domain-containing protein [Candidatus Peregrinibacteria bacterium]|nr:transglycosylase domain-containing protein [Candidatus Peregrinibacteria bacterium]
MRAFFSVIAGLVIVFSASFHFLLAGLILMPTARAVGILTDAPFVQYSEIPAGVRQAFFGLVENVQLRPDRQGVLRVVAGVLELRGKLKKRERMELALNTLPFGGEVIGIENGAKYYFNKSVRDLTSEEAITLAAFFKIFTLK